MLYILFRDEIRRDIVYIEFLLSYRVSNFILFSPNKNKYFIPYEIKIVNSSIREVIKRLFIFLFLF